MDFEIINNADQSRDEIRAGGGVAGFAQYRLHNGRLTFFHTEVDPAHEGAGLGGRLARAALEDARAHGLAIVPVCPFIAAYVRRHRDEYLDLVVPAMREPGG